MKKQHSTPTSKYDNVIERLRELLGATVFKQYPNINWVAQQGTLTEGTLLEMRGVRIPPNAVEWFQKRLEGHLKFKFVDNKDGNKTLCIIDVDNTLTIRNLMEQDRTMSARDHHYINQKFFTAPSETHAVESILGEASDQFVKQIELDIARENQIQFTTKMRADCKQRVIQMFKQKYSSGEMDLVDNPLALLALIEPIKAAIVEDYRAKQSVNKPRSW